MALRLLINKTRSIFVRVREPHRITILSRKDELEYEHLTAQIDVLEKLLNNLQRVEPKEFENLDFRYGLGTKISDTPRKFRYSVKKIDVMAAIRTKLRALKMERKNIIRGSKHAQKLRE